MTDVPSFEIFAALHPELHSVFGKLDPEEEPARYTDFASRVLEQALRGL